MFVFRHRRTAIIRTAQDAKSWAQRRRYESSGGGNTRPGFYTDRIWIFNTSCFGHIFASNKIFYPVRSHSLKRSSPDTLTVREGSNWNAVRPVNNVDTRVFDIGDGRASTNTWQPSDWHLGTSFCRARFSEIRSTTPVVDAKERNFFSPYTPTRITVCI